MCKAPGHSVTILYGSQTGNAREMAKALCEEACERGLDARVLGMEQFKTLDFEEVPKLVIVSSTTGNGDAPDNADKFFRYVKRPSTPKIFTKTQYAIFGLGDSNYEAFCHVPKVFDEHIQRLGGTPMLKRCDADEVEGLETFFDPWKEKLWKALENADPNPQSAAAHAAEKAVPLAPAASPAASPAPAPAPVRAPAASAAADDSEALGASWERALMAPVVAARWLTAEPDAAEPEAEQRRVLHVELDVSGAGEVMRFEAGDAIAVVTRHDEDTVASLLAQLGVSTAVADAPLSLGSSAPAHLQPFAGGDSLTPREALLARVDIGSVSTWPPPSLLKLLLASPASTTPAADAAGAAKLREQLKAATAGGAAGRTAHAALQREKPPLSELLSRLGVTPNLAKLLDVLPPLAPRWYSLANASVACPGRAHLCLSVVSYTTTAADGTTAVRRGVASNMLARLCAPLLTPPAAGGGGGRSANVDVRVGVFKRPASGNELRLPAQPATPIMLVGPGTGLAPFRSFLQERRTRWGRKALGPCHLFFGCRAPHLDFLYADELRTLHDSGAIALHTAFSRADDPAAAGYWRGVRVGIAYVQDHLEAHGEELARLLYRENGQIYVCGDGQRMAADVHAALRQLTMDHLGIGSDAAEAKLAELIATGRYQREIWH